MHLEMSVSKILAHRRLWYILQNYQNFIEMTSNMTYIVALGGGLKCPHKIHLNSQCLPDFDRSVNPIPTRGRIGFCPRNYYTLVPPVLF